MPNRAAIGSSEQRFRHLERALKSVVLRSLKILGKDGFFLEIGLLGDPVMKGLNRRFRGRNKATNVLSFEAGSGFSTGASGLSYLGEIYLGPDYIERNGEDIFYMTVHGLLHLLHYAHRKKSDNIKMRRLEERLLRKLKSKH